MKELCMRITSLRLFLLDRVDKPIPINYIMNFRALIEKHKLFAPLFQEVEWWVVWTRHLPQEGTHRDAQP